MEKREMEGPTITIDQTAKDLHEWIERQARRGAHGLKLFRRLGPDAADLEPIDSYVIGGTSAAEVWTDMQANARGDTEAVARFTLQSFGNGNADALASRSFSIIRAPIASDLLRPEPRHVPDRYEGNADNMIRLLLEQNHEAHKVITTVIPAVVSMQAQLLGALAQPLATMAETHDQAIRELREARALSQDHERELLKDAAQQKRIDQLYEAGAQLLPMILAKLQAENGKAS